MKEGYINEIISDTSKQPDRLQDKEVGVGLHFSVIENI